MKEFSLHGESQRDMFEPMSAIRLLGNELCAAPIQPSAESLANAGFRYPLIVGDKRSTFIESPVT
jgi:hypothetical protein